MCKKLLNLVQVNLTKYREMKVKSAKKWNFLALKDIFLTSPDVVHVRFCILLGINLHNL